jgi:hypothetical protein
LQSFHSSFPTFGFLLGSGPRGRTPACEPLRVSVAFNKIELFH